MGTGALARQVKRLQKGGLWVQQVQVLLLAFTISVLTLSVRSGRILLSLKKNTCKEVLILLILVCVCSFNPIS